MHQPARPANGAECSQPLATARMATGLAVNGAHSVVVTAKGDTVDGVTVRDVPSLSAVVGRSVCCYPRPTGTDTGFRTFGVARRCSPAPR